MALAYLIPLSQGWAQPQTAAITIMLIAAMGSMSESVHKGAMRVLGTIIGAIVGMTLIAIFPQDRFYYLLSLSIAVTITLYILRAYKGDPTIFMLSAMTMMMVFKNGEVDDVFIFGLDKTYMTVFGIMIYTMVGMFLWPVNIEDNTKEKTLALNAAQHDIFLHRDAEKEERSKLLESLLEHETQLENARKDADSPNIDMHQWHSIVHSYRTINAHLTLLSMHDKEEYSDHFSQYISNYKQLEDEIVTLFTALPKAWQKKEEIHVPNVLDPQYQTKIIKNLSHLERASLLTTIQDMQKLHDELRKLANKLNSVHSPFPSVFETDDLPSNKRFIWGDTEHLKAALVSFIIFWVATYFWITFNPPGGFMIVALATGLSVLTTFTPIKPSMLIIVFTFSFIFATFMYIVVLPHLRYGWELGLFIFFYSFVSFHLINPKMTIFFLLGLFTFNINNTMYYDFSIFLLVLLLFYTFLLLLHIFYYVPFSTKPEHLFIQLKNRFFRLSKNILARGRKEQEGKNNYLISLYANYSHTHLMNTVKKMQLWATQLDVKYFNTIDKEALIQFTKECEKFAYLLELLYLRDLDMKKNPLIAKLKDHYTLPYFSDVLGEYALGKNVQEIDAFWKDEKNIVHKVEESLSEILESIDFNAYHRDVIVQLYENISLRRNVWLSLFVVQREMEKLDFKILEENKF